MPFQNLPLDCFTTVKACEVAPGILLMNANGDIGVSCVLETNGKEMKARAWLSGERHFRMTDRDDDAPVIALEVPPSDKEWSVARLNLELVDGLAAATKNDAPIGVLLATPSGAYILVTKPNDSKSQCWIGLTTGRMLPPDIDHADCIILSQWVLTADVLGRPTHIASNPVKK